MKHLKAFPKIKASSWPTPVEPLTRLSRRLGGPDIFMKRDDIGSLALGGNKLRKLEFLLGEALNQGCCSIVTAGALQSNHARLTAAISSRLGLDCHLVLKDEVPDRSAAYHSSANRFLDNLLGAQVEVIDREASLPDALSARADALVKLGRKPYVIPVGGSSATGNLGYVECAQEIAQQQASFDKPFTHIIVTSGSGGTHAGILVGCDYAGLKCHVSGVAISRSAAEQRNIVLDLASQTAALLDRSPDKLGDNINIDDGFYLPGYGLPNQATLEAVLLCARMEGILLDPVYTGKAMAALIAGIRNKTYRDDDRILFIHTGGAPALFAYDEEFSAAFVASGEV